LFSYMMNKKGSHVGMVLSFVIFVIFLVFTISILQPAVKQEKDKRALLEYLKNELANELSDQLNTTVIELKNSQGNANCITLSGLGNFIFLKNLIVKNQNSQMLNYDIDSS